MYRSLIAMTLMVAPLSVASAQTAAPDSGERIRITTVGDDRAKNGTLISLTPDTVVYHPEFMLAVKRMPLDSVRGIERSRGRQMNVHSMLVGVGIGGVIGLGVTAAIAALPYSGDGPPPAIGAVYLAPLLIGGGMVVGGYIGAEHRTESWSQLYPDIADASMIVGPSARNGFSFGLSVPYDVPLSIDDDVPPDSLGQSAEP